jgi:hypothetical protein
METDTRYTAHQTALQSGWKSINEVRAEEGLAPVTGGEEPRVQMQYIPLSMVDQAILNQSSSEPSSAPAPTPTPTPAPAPKKMTGPKTFKKLNLDLLTTQVAKNLWGENSD